MYVCNCNGITERQVKAAAEAGDRQWTDVHARYGFVPQCGQCGVDIAAYLTPDQAAEAVPINTNGFAKA